MADLRRLSRELAGASYYRRRPLEAARFLASKVRYRSGRCQPGELLAHLGFDPAVLEGLDTWRGELTAMEARISGVDSDQGPLSQSSCSLLYGLVRALEPEVTIETGIASGASTAYLAAALVDNGSGRLISVDLPPYHERVEDGSTYDWEARPVGWAMPDTLRRQLGPRHEIVLEDVRTCLPRLLDREGAIDLFVHDDLHTPDHMRWEYDLVWPRVRPGGVIVSDDANHAWLSFSRAVQARPEVANVDRMVGVRKPDDRQASAGSGLASPGSE